MLAGCDTPLSTLAPAGPAAEAIGGLWWGMLIGAGGLTLMVLALVALGFRAPAAMAGRQPRAGFWTHGMGVGFSLAILAVVVGAGIWTGERLQPHADPDVVSVEARGRQWAWSFRQPDATGAMVETEGRLFIPAGRPVDVHVSSADVIHSFWVPRLAGKMDAIPGRTNILRIEARAPGIYEGLSAEFSGPGYGGMRFQVIAYPPEDPPAFVDTPGLPGAAATEPTPAMPVEGAEE
ncbi:cytochrome c oxidase subunit II [Pseudogemmobacter sonorensis]|uniref:cytochrome c oxidase subunit II n=1 Tax=Pseudogemmobacter sonorensis TaxID=2989681 RepID=UPI0036AF65FA